MKIFSKCLFVSLLQLFCYYGPGSAQTPIDLPEALQTARKQNLTLQQQKDSQHIARLQEWVQRAQRLPTLNFLVNSTYFSKISKIDLSRTLGIPGRSINLGGHDQSQVILNLNQPIFTGFRLSSQVELADTQSLSEKAKFETLADDVYHQVYLIFYQAQSLYNEKRILDASLQRLQVQLEQARSLFQAAQVMAFDTLQVYNQALSVKIDIENNHLSSRLLNLQLARVLDLPQTRPIADMQLQHPAPRPMQLDRLKQEAIQHRPELESIRLAQRSAEIQQKLARSNYFPQIFAQANFYYAKPGLDPVNNNWMDYFTVGVNLQWNLWRWKADENRVQESEVQHHRLTLEEEQLLKTIQYQVEESFENINFSLKQLNLLEELQAQQQERYRIISVQHQHGIASTNDVITAETDLTRAQLQTKQSLIQYYVFLSNLEKAVGTLGEDIVENH